MVLTNKEADIIIRMLDFCEENWSAFTQRCEEAGISTAEADVLTEIVREKINE